MKIQSLALTMQRLKRGIARDLKVCLPATIEEYDFKTQKASVQIDLKEVLANDTSIDYPIITNVPVIFPSSGGASLTMPVKRGDNCIVFFLDRDISSWLIGLSKQAPSSARMHNLNDAVALMGLFPFSVESAAKNNTDLMLSYDDSEILMKPNGEIEILSAKSLKVKTEDIDIKCVNADIKSSGKIDINCADELNIKAENITINCTNANIKATGEINTEAINFTQKGKLIVDGDIEVTGKSSLKGKTICESTIEGQTVKTSCGIDLKSHKHSYQEAQQGSQPTVVTPSITGGAS